MELPRELVEALRDVRSAGVITGAGVSKESGIRTYRGEGGIYDDPEKGDETIESVTGTTLREDPDRTWRTVAEMARQSLHAQPNAAHRAIAEMERRLERFVLLTQNVDGLHQAAGSRNVIDIHGSLQDTVCMRCEKRGSLTREDWASIRAAPKCAACGGILRPDVILFGEMLPLEKLARMRSELIENIPDLVVSVGTSALFPYIQQPVILARYAGKLTVEVNPERTELSSLVHFSLQGPAGTVLPLLVEALGSRAD